MRNQVMIFCSNCGLQFAWHQDQNGLFKSWVTCACGQVIPAMDADFSDGRVLGGSVMRIVGDSSEPRLSIRGVLFGSLIGLAGWIVAGFLAITMITLCKG